MLAQPDVSLSTHLVGEPPGVDDERLVDHQYRMGDTNRQTYLLQQQEKQEHARTARDVCDSLSKVQVLARKRAKSEIREGGTHGMPEVEKSYILPVRGNHTQAGQRERRDRDSTLLAVSARRAIFSR